MSHATVPAYVGLGSNLHDPIAQVRAAFSMLGRLPASRLARCSSLYRTRPVGDVVQPDFINAACRLDTSLAPRVLLGELLGIEARRGRVRDGGAGGPRVLDLDLLLYGELRIDEDRLLVPHPRLHARAFVLYPLTEIAPDLVIPGHGPAAALLAACAGQGVERLTEPAGA